jgi:type I restriction enzyme M protein
MAARKQNEPRSRTLALDCPTEKDPASASLEKRLWDAADQFRANSGLKARENPGPILGLIFLRSAETSYAAQRAKLEEAGSSSRRGSRVDEPAAYHADNVLYLAPEAFESASQ